VCEFLGTNIGGGAGSFRVKNSPRFPRVAEVQTY
jgi:hypothetical protein